MENDTGIYISDKQVYEVNGLRPNSEEQWTVEVIECDSDAEAMGLAEAFGKQWWSRVQLYRVPFVNTTGTASSILWPDQIMFIADIAKPVVDPAFCTWMDELNREGVRRRLPDWPLPDETAHEVNCWIEAFERGLSPAQAFDRAGMHGPK
jgi:hypothetical protein